jgi:hypothetical protein
MAKRVENFSKKESESRFLAALRGAFGKTKPKAAPKKKRNVKPGK